MVTPARAAALVLLLGLCTRPVQAQDRPTPTSFLNKNVVHLPIQINDRDRPQLLEVQLWVKDGPQTPWTLREKAPATQSFFTYRAPQDGDYWFSVTTVDRAGRSIPADVSVNPPGLIVSIDTTPPQVEVVNLGAGAEG